MAKKEINIGIEGNDGTGDSIRDSFQKVNENFTELYAVLGQGGRLSFIGLDDVEKERLNKEYITSDNNKLLVVDAEGEQIVFKELVGSETIVVNQSVPGQIRLSSLASALINDPDPTLATSLNANFKRILNLAEGTEDTDAVQKVYVDSKLSLDGTDSEDVSGNARPDWGVMRGPLVLSRNPVEEDDVEYNGLVAATKAYVDSKTFISQYNIYVSPKGQDERTDIPQNQIGRSEATAYRTVQKACEEAERLINEAPFELGPYQKFLTYANGTEFCRITSVEESELSGTGCVALARVGIDEDYGFQILIAGTGYQKDDILTISGGTVLGQEAVFRVISVDFAGSILQLAIDTDADNIKQYGIYSILPASYIDSGWLNLTGGSGSGTARIRARWQITQIDVAVSGENYTSASVIFVGGGGTGAEAVITEIGGEVKEITVTNSGSGYTAIPEVEVYLPRMLVSTGRRGTDFQGDIREGQGIRGETSGALCRIVQNDGTVDEDGNEIFEIEVINGVFQLGERVQYADLTKEVQICIRVETGIYYENYPLRLAENVTIQGEDMRRTIIRPKPGVSESRWARVFFRRDPVIDGLRVTPHEFGYQYLRDPLDFSSQPKNNDEMDVFLCNDASRIQELSVQGHGGFVMVLDPDGQILSKSPYFQTGSSFSKSINEKQFAGGQFIDGFSGNLEGILLNTVAVDPSDPAYVPSDPTTHREYDKIIVGGLLRELELPTSFNIDDNIYRITLANRVETDLFDTKILLERNRRFIQTEVIAFVNGTYPTLDYDQDKCYRDVGLLVDAVVQDVLYGGTLNSTQAARLYFSAGQTVVAGQVTETVAAIEKLKEVAVAVINQDTGYGRVGTIDQVFLPAYPNSPDGEAVVEKCCDLISNIIRYGETIYRAKGLIQENKEIIQAETIAYLNDLYPSLNYDRETCYRDVGYILDAYSIDMFGDFNNSVKAGYSYFRQGARIIPDAGPTSQLAQTIDGIEYATTLAKRIIKNQSISDLARTAQTFNPGAAVDLVSNRITIVNHGFTSGSRVLYNNGGGTSMVADNLRDDEGLPITEINNRVFYVFVIDGNTIQLVPSLSLLIAKEKGVSDAIELNFISAGTGSSHSLSFFQETDSAIVLSDLTASGAEANIDEALGYISDLISGVTAGVPGIYPQYECLLDGPYYGAGLFDEAKCSRDVGLILDAVNYDMVLGSNYQSAKAGLAYLRSYSSTVITEQKTQTLRGISKAEEEALELIPGATYATARSVLSSRFETIRNIISNGVGSAPVISYPLPTGMSASDNRAKTRDILVANTDFIKAEIVAYVLDNNPGFDFSTSTCARDVEYILQGMIYDVLYGGNSQTKDNAESYYYGNVSLVPEQEAVTAAAFTRLKQILPFIVVNDTGSWTKSLSNAETQDVSLPAATSSEGTLLSNLTDLVIDYVADGDFDTSVTVTLPTIIGQDADLLAARTLIIDAKADIQTTTIEYLNNVTGKITLSTAGNKSMLGNDFTQVNDMGYGIFVTNNGLSEQVSTFTYYCYTAFYSLNGAQIRSLNGSSSHGVFGLKAEGADPNEVPDSVTLKFPLIQTANIYENIDLDIENVKNSVKVWITNYQYPPRSGSLLDIDHTGDPGSGVTIGQRTYIVENVSTQGLPEGVVELQLSAVAAQAGLALDVPAGKPVLLRLNEEIVLSGKEEVVSVRPSTALIFSEFTDKAIRVLSFNQYEDQDAVADDQIIGTRDGYTYVQLTLKEDGGTFLLPDGFTRIGDNQAIVQLLSFSDANRVVFPTTGAAIVDGSTIGTGGMIFGYQDSLYEILDYEPNTLDPNNNFGIITFRNLTNPLQVNRSHDFTVVGALPAQLQLTSDHYLTDSRPVLIDGTVYYVKNVNDPTDYIGVSGTNVTGDGISATFDISVTNSLIYDSVEINTAGTGYEVGDTIRVLGTAVGGTTPANDLVITVDGVGGSGDITNAVISRGLAKIKRNEIQLYVDEGLTTPVNSSALGAATSLDVVGGLTFSPLDSNGTNISWQAGLRAGATGTVTVNISTMRATGHDFLDIGTGSYADTNYPSNIFGEPVNAPDTERQVVEVTTGRVFYVSTDQNGNFKVGDFFAVDQGTGRLTLDAKIDLKGIDTLKLRTGQEISEFTNDITMGGEGEADQNAVPTEYAVRQYIDSRLGKSHFGGNPTIDLRGPGFLPLDGSNRMKGSIDMDGFTINSLPRPRRGALGDTEAVPKFFMKLGNLEDAPDYWRPALGDPTYAIDRADVMAFTGTDSEFTHATMIGALTLTLDTTTPTDPKITATINDNVIVDADINYDANIQQHKLDLNYTRDTAADGISITAYAASTVSGFTTLTAATHGLSENDSVVIAGETTTSLLGLNKTWRAVNVTTDTFDIAITGLTGIISGNAKVRKPGLISAAKTSEFQVSADGFLQLRPSSSISTGVTFEKLAYINPATSDATDETGYITGTKLLGRRSLPTAGDVVGPPVPIDARTVVRDGYGLSKFDVPSIGVLVRIDEDNTPGVDSFTSVDYGPSNASNAIIQRDNDGDFAANEATLNGLTLNGDVIISTPTPSLATPKRIKFQVNSTTADSLYRQLVAGGDNAYKTVLCDGNGNSAIELYHGNSSTNQHADYLANEHRFYNAGGGSGTINLGDGILKSESICTIQGIWQLDSGASMQATWADLAEWYTSDQEYEPGTVLEFGGDSEVRASTKQGTTKVAGVVTTNPAYVMNQHCQGTKSCVALQGRVPCKVIGKIEKGDLMISSSISGVAMSAGEDARPGTIIGKALENYDSDQIGTIEVAVGRL